MPHAQSATKPDRRRQLSSTPETAWLRFDRNVSRDLVHRTALAEVLVADTVQVADDEFLLATQLPRAHILWSDRGYPYHDPLITVEVCRQACIATLQRYYDVGPDWQFVSKRIDFHVLNLEAYADDEASPPEGILRTRISNKSERRGLLYGMTVENELTIDGRPGGSVCGDVIVLPRATYENWRMHQLKLKGFDRRGEPSTVRPLDSARVGRLLHRNVVIGDSRKTGSPSGECRYAAIADPTHPCFFDHPLDHLPGALIMEIYRQAAVATAASEGIGVPEDAVITDCEVRLSDFAELQTTLECSAVAVGWAQEGRVQIASALHQFDRQIGSGQVGLRFLRVAEGG